MLITLINFILVAIALVGFILTIFGTPIGIILLIIYFVKLKKKKNTKLLKLSLILLSGLPLLIIAFVGYGIVNLIATFFGVNTLGSSTKDLLPIRIY